MTIEFMEAITQAKGNYETMLYAYLVKSWNAGVMPELNQCVVAEKKREEFEAPVYSRFPGAESCVEIVWREKATGIH